MSKKKRERCGVAYVNGGWDDFDFVGPQQKLRPWTGDAPSFIEVKPHEEIAVSIVTSTSLTDYVVRLASHAESFQELENRMTSFYQCGAKVPQNSVGLSEGTFCVYYDLDSRNCFRAFVESLRTLTDELAENPLTYHDPDVALVCLVDYATRTRVRQRDLYQMDERFATEPISAFNVRLDGLKHPSMVISGHEAECAQYWATLENNRDANMVIHRNDESGGDDIFIVDLLVGKDKHQTNLKSLLPQVHLLGATTSPSTPS